MTHTSESPVSRHRLLLWVACVLLLSVVLVCGVSCHRDDGETPGVPDSHPVTDSVEESRPGTGETDGGETWHPENGDPTESSVSPENGDPTESSVSPENGDPTESSVSQDEEPTGTAEPESDTGDTTEAIPALTLPPETTPEPPTEAVEMPRLDIYTDGGQGITSKEQYVHATVSLSQCHEVYAFSDEGAQIRVRGNSTAGAPKKPYRLKFDRKIGLLGLNGRREYKDWCLMADYFDGSMLRTYGTFRMAYALLEHRTFSSDCVHVEVYVNQAYQGVYLLCEQSEINRGRVDIMKRPAGSTDVQIGYLLIGQGGRSDEPETVVVYPGITVRDRNGKTMHFPAMNFALSGNGYTDEQKEYVSRYVSAVFKVVASAVYEHRYYDLSRDGQMTPKRTFAWAKTPEEKQMETVGAVFHIDSAVSMCILDELVKNLDAMTFNMYVDLSPDGDGVLTLAAPWDFDFSMANTHYATTHSTAGFYATNLSVSEGMRTNLWYVLLGSIDWFDELVQAKWKQVYPKLLEVVKDMEAVNIRFDAAFNRDFDRWGIPARRSLIHHHDKQDLARFDVHGKAGAFVVNWLSARIRWLNRQWGDPQDIPSAEPLVMDFTKPETAGLVSKFRRCTGKTTDKGLLLRPDAECRDPYFYIDFSRLPDICEGESYPYVEITYMAPASCRMDRYVMELYLCAGSVTTPTGGISTTAEVRADGQFHTLRVNLGATGFWDGPIHLFRIDFFSECQPGDSMYIREVRFLSD